MILVAHRGWPHVWCRLYAPPFSLHLFNLQVSKVTQFYLCRALGISCDCWWALMAWLTCLNNVYINISKKTLFTFFPFSWFTFFQVSLLFILICANWRYFNSPFLEEKDNIYNLHSTVSLKQPKCNTVTYGLIWFRYKSAKIWNDLPSKIKNSITLVEFKNQIKKWQGPKCLCNMCTRLL